jgi:hypothetical protein
MKPLRGPLKNLGKAMGDTFANFGKFLNTKGMQTLFTTLINSATILAPLIGQIFQPMLSLIGKIAQAAMPFLIKGFKSFAGWLGKLDKNTSVGDIRKQLRKIIPYLGDWFDLSKKLFPTFLDLLVAIAPYAKDLMKWIGGVAKNFGDWLKRKHGRKEVYSFFKNVLPLAIDFVKAVGFLFVALLQISRAVGKIKGAFDSLTHLKLPGPDWLWSQSAFNKKLGEIDWGKLASGIWDGLKKGLEVGGKVIIDMLFGPLVIAYRKLKDWLGIGSPSKLFFRLGLDIMRGLFNGIKSVPGRVYGWIRDKFAGAIGFLKNLAGRFINFGRRAANSLWSGLKGTAFSVFGWLRGKFTAAINFLKNLPGRMFNWGRSLIRGLWEGIRSTGFSVWGWIKGKFESAIGYLKTLPNRFYKLGTDIAKGLWKGIKDRGRDVKNAIVNTAKGAFNKVKGFFHIGSPSKLMMELGHNVGRGFELGIDASSARVARSATRSFALPTVAAAASSAVGSHGTTIQNQTVNLPAAPGHDQMGDPRHQAAQFAREMRRRGRR